MVFWLARRKRQIKCASHIEHSAKHFKEREGDETTTIMHSTILEYVRKKIDLLFIARRMHKKADKKEEKKNVCVIYLDSGGLVC